MTHVPEARYRELGLQWEDPDAVDAQRLIALARSCEHRWVVATIVPTSIIVQAAGFHTVDIVFCNVCGIHHDLLPELDWPSPRDEGKRN